MKTARLRPAWSSGRLCWLSLASAAMVSMVLALSALVAPPASAADETATASLSMTARQGKLFKQALRPVNLKLGGEIRAPWPASPTVLPMKVVDVGFPTDMKFVPKKNFPVCPRNRIGPPPVNLSVPPQTAIARCPKAVIGNGSAELYLAQANGPNGPNLKDPVLVIFNAGRTKAGLARISVYGYSKGTSAGVFMGGVLKKNGTLRLSIPVLTADSAVGKFDFEIPATEPIIYDNRSVPGSVGRDKSYAQARCSNGTWGLTADFVLGTRNDAGEPTGPSETVTAPPVTEDCVGAPGKPNLKWVKVNGPNKMKRGQRKRFKVRVTNNGTAVMRNIRIVANGKWIRKNRKKTANLWPGKTRWVNVPVRLTGKAKRKKATVLKVRVNPGNTKAKVGKKRIRVR